MCSAQEEALPKLFLSTPATITALDRAQTELLDWVLRVHAGTIDDLPDSLVTLALENQELAQLLTTLRDGASNLMADPTNFQTAVKALSEEIKRFERLHQQLESETDALTGVHNRRGMIRDLHREWNRAQRSMDPLCIAMADIDHFKEVNDTFGHQVGDKVLTHVAQFLEGRLRPYDTVYRYGGEEFLLCLPLTDIDRAEMVLDRLRRILSRTPVHITAGTVIPVTISLGLVEFSPGVTVPGAIAAADRALYTAKAKGRNQLVCAGQVGPSSGTEILH